MKSGFHFWDQFDAPTIEQRIVLAKNRGHSFARCSLLKERIVRVKNRIHFFARCARGATAFLLQGSIPGAGAITSAVQLGAAIRGAVLVSFFKRCRFPAKIILLCERWCCKYRISYRDLAEIMQEAWMTRSTGFVTLFSSDCNGAPENRRESHSGC
ncbi:hypothetical protein [Microvirga sp. TS319]|uniref:hypothetical protein n=1 Tax=Microvirga sp. TS319 TaxID=3241165 RepID=UPI00351A263F